MSRYCFRMDTILPDIGYRDVLIPVCQMDTAKSCRSSFKNTKAYVDDKSLFDAPKLFLDDGEAQRRELRLHATELGAGS